MIKNFFLKAAIIVVSVIMACYVAFGQTTDYQPLTKEDVNLVLADFDGKQPSEIINKAEILISSGKDDTEKGIIAYYIYDYYRNSKYMGYDEIAI